MDHPAVTRLAPDVYFVEAPMKGRFPFCHSFVFVGEKNLLIDAGLGEDLMREIDELFGIDILLISHSHPDHIRSWHTLDHKSLWLPEETGDAVHSLEDLGTQYTGSREAGRHWVKVIGEPFGIVPLRKPDRCYRDGEIIDLGTARIEAIRVPGHHDDHYCFLDHTSGTLITTDIDFSSFGPWYGNPEGHVRTFRKGVEKIMTLPCQRVCASHRGPVEGRAHDLFKAYLSAFDRQKKDIFNALDGGRTLDELVAISPIYNNKFLDRIIQNVFERHMIEENLALLVDEGRVIADHGIYRPL